MREGGERRGAEPDRLALELGRERRRKQMLETSVFELRNTVAELEKRLSSVEDEGSEWKTRYETQVELNKQLERQINILQDKMELIRGNPAGRNKLSIVRTFDQMPVAEQSQLSHPLLICQMLQSLHHLHSPVLDLLQEVPVLLVPGSPELDPALQICLTSAKEKGRITSLDLLAAFFLMEPGWPLAFFAARAHCWRVAILLSTRTRRSFSAKLLPSQ
ncbi:coiled-coil domain-containing protein 169 isoform X3 [Haliaeetus albicilla]|uniref:coiled-coil domain-containing protein 169 isoform X3 n=1 Tax=Haliaeetus albicilla TaxID=8969 RepID=UPI0037E70639